MPEGDSVYKLARRLEPALAGRRLARGELRVPAYATLDLAGAQVAAVDTHGKHLLTRLVSAQDEALTLHTHLKMSGSWTVVARGKRLPARLMDQVRVLLAVRDGPTAYGLDMPLVEVLPTAREDDAVGYLGPDPLRDDDPAPALARLAVDARPVGEALLDQRVVAGLGNIYVDEVLFAAGVHPTRKADTLTKEEVRDIYAATRDILSRAIELRGTTFDSYHDAFGENGKFQHRLKIFARAGEPCLVCGTEIEKSRVAGRGTHVCPTCQPVG